jgi:glycosyltransferase involved in cell wall biosynthesis
LEQIARIQLPQNVKYTFLGFVQNGGVISFYQNNQIDVFINISSSEGTPVSIMEAQSCSIPVIATAVGGNSEIVTNDNGLLLSENPEPREIANAICILLNDRNLIRDKKKKSYENWYNNYNSEKNLQAFVKELSNILKNNKKSALEKHT